MRRRGRKRGPRWITEIPPVEYFHPFGVPITHSINLTYEELEALRLVDLEGYTQEEAAALMGVSRKTLWNELKNARRKVALALVRGYAIRISGGCYALRGNIKKERR